MIDLRGPQRVRPDTAVKPLKEKLSPHFGVFGIFEGGPLHGRMTPAAPLASSIRFGAVRCIKRAIISWGKSCGTVYRALRCALRGVPLFSHKVGDSTRHLIDGDDSRRQ